jgi:hypothetical protein
MFTLLHAPMFCHTSPKTGVQAFDVIEVAIFALRKIARSTRSPKSEQQRVLSYNQRRTLALYIAYSSPKFDSR